MADFTTLIWIGNIKGVMDSLTSDNFQDKGIVHTIWVRHVLGSVRRARPTAVRRLPCQSGSPLRPLQKTVCGHDLIQGTSSSVLALNDSNRISVVRLTDLTWWRRTKGHKWQILSQLSQNRRGHRNKVNFSASSVEINRIVHARTAQHRLSPSGPFAPLMF